MNVQDNNSNNPQKSNQPGTDPAAQQQDQQQTTDQQPSTDQQPGANQQPGADQQPPTQQPDDQPAVQSSGQPAAQPEITPAEPETQPPAQPESKQPAQPETQEQGSDYVSSYTPPKENEVSAAGDTQTDAGETQTESGSQPSTEDTQSAEQNPQDQGSQPATITPPPTTQPVSADQPTPPEQPASTEPKGQPPLKESGTTPAAQPGSPQQDASETDVDLDKEIERLEKMVQDLEANVPKDKNQAETKTDSEPKKEEEDKPAQEETPESPPTAKPPKPESTAQPASSQVEPAQTSGSNQSTSQKLADQNIFFLLGVEDGTDEEKNKFLDELQQVVWEDFLENDMDKLVTGPEKEQVRAILQDNSLSELDKQEKALSLLEKTLPNFEDLMIEKAMELKSDLFKERIAGMKEYYAQDQASLDKIAQAETQLQQENWRLAAETLNQLIAKPKKA